MPTTLKDTAADGGVDSPGRPPTVKIRVAHAQGRAEADRAWIVQQGHHEAERVEAALRQRLSYATVFTHLEPIEDPRSYDDTRLDKEQARAAG